MADKVPLKLLVDKEKKRVVLAEAGKEFVDILLSFLTLPMGTIARLTGMQLGCLRTLYGSVQYLSTDYLETVACKSMLLYPRNAAAARCQELKINIDGTNSKRTYTCFDCIIKPTTPLVYSTVEDTNCIHCGQRMWHCSRWTEQEQSPSFQDGGFIKGGVTFTITDDLHVTETSTRNTVMLLEKLGLQDRSNMLEERTLNLGQSEILNLLTRSLISRMPLSDIYFGSFPKTGETDSMKETIHPITETEKVEGEESGKISAKLLIDEVNNNVVYAEAGEELINLLFSFLTFPLGSVIKILGKYSSVGCIDNLYISAQNLGISYFNSEECKSQRVSPKLAPFFSCSNQLLKVQEQLSYGEMRCAKDRCCWKSKFVRASEKCEHEHDGLRISELNPKMTKGVAVTGGGFAKKLAKFVLTDSLSVKPLTPISIIQTANNSKVSPEKLVEKDISIGPIQALNLLRAALTSQSALTKCLLSK